MFLKSFQNSLVLALCLLAPLALSGCSGSSNTATVVVGGGSIQGVLVDASTQEPIVGAVVDIGVTKATTSLTGQFTFSGLSAATYQATIDLTNVTSPTTTATTRYPKYVFQPLTANSLPTSGVASTTFQVIPIGKQAANISGVVTDNSGAPVGVGYNVTLSTSAVPATVVSTAQTTATGAFSFLNVQSQGKFIINAADTAGSIATPAVSAVAVTAPLDGGTISKTVSVSSTNNQPPTVVSVTPQHNADIAPVANQTVVFTFSRPIKQTAAVSSVTPSNPNGLYSFVAVNFTGNKAIRASNIAHSLAWSADRTQLTVTLPVVAVSATYVVDLCNAPLTDDAGLQVSGLGTACSSPAPVLPLVAGTAGKGYVSFTTNGGVTAAAPAAVSLTNLASLDAAKGVVAAIKPTLDWQPVSGAKAYNIYRSTKQVWGATVNTHPAVKLNTTPLFASNYTDTTLADYVENGHIKLTYDYTVTSLNSDSIESAGSTAVTAADVIPPSLLAGSVVNCGAPSAATCNAASKIVTVTIPYDEVMDKASVQTNTNYTISLAATATGVIPTVSSATYTANNVALALSTPVATADLPLAGYISTGPDGIANTTAAAGDTQAIPVGQGLPSTVCINAGAANPALLTLAAVAPDVLVPAAPPVKAYIKSGPAGLNGGICQTTAAAGDVQVIPVGKGLANQKAITVSPATPTAKLATTAAAGDDVLGSAGAFVTVTGVTDVAGNALNANAKTYNVDGTVK